MESSSDFGCALEFFRQLSGNHSGARAPRVRRLERRLGECRPRGCYYPGVNLTRTLLALALAAPGLGPAASPDPAAEVQATPLKAADIPDPAVPLRIPGYELRVLERKKPVRFNVAGVWAESALPLFIYVPTADPVRASGLVREAHDSLLKLGQKPEWTADDLRGVLTTLDAAIGALAADPAPAGPNPAFHAIGFEPAQRPQ